MSPGQSLTLSSCSKVSFASPSMLWRIKCIAEGRGFWGILSSSGQSFDFGVACWACVLADHVWNARQPGTSPEKLALLHAFKVMIMEKVLSCPLDPQIQPQAFAPPAMQSCSHPHSLLLPSACRYLLFPLTHHYRSTRSR
jgi:hypothetical protein